MGLNTTSTGVLHEVLIGECRLILGDCLQGMRSFRDVGHIVSDPPYESFMHAAKGAKGRKLRTDKGPELAALDFASIEAIREPFVELAAGICKGWAILFCTPEGVGRWADAINASAMRYKRACVWVKPDATPQMNGQGPAMGAENFVAAWCGEGFSRWNGGGKRGVYTHNTNAPDRHGKHPTEKPWRLMAEILRDFTNPGELILDPFMGSGSTGVACIKQGRPFVGIEVDPVYFGVAVERVTKAYEAATAQVDLFARPFKPTQPSMDLKGNRA